MIIIPAAFVRNQNLSSSFIVFALALMAQYW